MRRMLFILAAGLALGLAALEGAEESKPSLAARILADQDLPLILEKGRALLKTGLNAGSGYGEVWIRDLNTFIEMALSAGDAATIREALLNFFKFQEADGNIPDGYIPREKSQVAYKYRKSDLAPGFLAHKNTVETDQETSLVQAVRKYVMLTGDRKFLEERIAGRNVTERLGMALDYVMEARFDSKHGLVWGATTADWGDVQPEHDWGVELDESSHRAMDIYDNAMMVVAMNDYLTLLGDGHPQAERWVRMRDALKGSIRRHLWDEDRQKFVPHLYLEGSPFPAEFDESKVFYHGGTAVAIEAGLLSVEEIKVSLEQMRANVKKAGAGTIGLTVYPPYPAGYFKNRSMVPYGYQNGGDWCWFGGRMVQQLVRYGLVEEAYEELRPMVARVLQHGDFYEWWSRDNEPRGSGRFRGSAGVLGVAIERMRDWARQQPGREGGGLGK